MSKWWTTKTAIMQNKSFPTSQMSKKITIKTSNVENIWFRQLQHTLCGNLIKAALKAGPCCSHCFSNTRQDQTMKDASWLPEDRNLICLSLVGGEKTDRESRQVCGGVGRLLPRSIRGAHPRINLLARHQHHQMWSPQLPGWSGSWVLESRLYWVSNIFSHKHTSWLYHYRTLGFCSIKTLSGATSTCDLSVPDDHCFFCSATIFLLIIASLFIIMTMMIIIMMMMIIIIMMIIMAGEPISAETDDSSVTLLLVSVVTICNRHHHHHHE